MLEQSLLHLGTLRDQVIYPDRQLDMVKKGYTDRDLEELLKIVRINILKDKEEINEKCVTFYN